jgi:ribosomal protein L15
MRGIKERKRKKGLKKTKKREIRGNYRGEGSQSGWF